MLVAGEPKFRRRKEARPAEIIEAAQDVFCERGFAAARLDDVAARAGVSKGAVYLYFETKEALFAAVVRDAIAPNLAAVTAFADAYDGDIATLLRLLVPRAADTIRRTRAARVVRIVFGESRNFPELARLWHDAVAAPALDALGRLVRRAQAHGEVRPGDPMAYAFSIGAPLIMASLWNEALGPVGGRSVDLEALAAQHVELVLKGLLIRPEPCAGATVPTTPEG